MYNQARTYQKQGENTNKVDALAKSSKNQIDTSMPIGISIQKSSSANLAKNEIMKKLKAFVAAAIVAVVALSAGSYSYETSQEKLLAQEQELLFLDENLEALTQSETFVERISSGVRFGDYLAPATMHQFYYAEGATTDSKKRITIWYLIKECQLSPDYRLCDTSEEGKTLFSITYWD